MPYLVRICRGYRIAELGQTARAMSQNDRDLIFDLCTLRARNEFLEQDLSCVLHLYYCFIVNVFTFAPGGLAKDCRRALHAKILRLPQGCPIGKRLIELDQQFGGLLETKGVWLKRWVYEPREKTSTPAETQW